MARQGSRVLGRFTVFTAAVLLAAAVCQAQAPTVDDFICTSPSERREIRVLPGCSVEYTKGGATSTLWSSHAAAYCAAKAAGLVTTLVKANFSCKTETTASAERIASSASDND